MLPLPAASNTVVINARCSLRIEAGQRVIIVAGLPVHHYRAEDAVAEAYAMGSLAESGFAQQTDVARRSPIGAHRAAVPRALCAGRDGGARSRGGLASRSTTYLQETSAQHRYAEEPGDEQPGDCARLGVSERPSASWSGPSQPDESAQLAFAEIHDRGGGEAADDSRAVCNVDRRC